MRERGCAAWDGGNSTWGGQARVIGTRGLYYVWATRFSNHGAKIGITSRFKKNKSYNVERAETREMSKLGLVHRLLCSHGRISATETVLLDFLAFRFLNDKVAASGYRQVKVLEFFHYPGLRQGVEDLKELLHKRAQGDRKAEVFQVSNDDTVVAQRRLEEKQLEDMTNTNCLLKEKEKEYHTRWKIKTRLHQ
nr:hypothetical protein [Tanacetum cinerariifolium]